jgi:hypothetical protein
MPKAGLPAQWRDLSLSGGRCATRAIERHYEYVSLGDGGLQLCSLGGAVPVAGNGDAERRPGKMRISQSQGCQDSSEFGWPAWLSGIAWFRTIPQMARWLTTQCPEPRGWAKRALKVDGVQI